MREPLAVPCEVEAASFSGRVPPSTREAVAYVDLCGLALLDPRTLRETWLPEVRGASRANFMDMNEQQENHKYALYVNGHSAPDRAARLFNGSQVVFRVRSAPAQSRRQTAWVSLFFLTRPPPLVSQPSARGVVWC